jgi:hypothetical protein
MVFRLIVNGYKKSLVESIGQWISQQYGLTMDKILVTGVNGQVGYELKSS